jgi:hypothetical protein
VILSATFHPSSSKKWSYEKNVDQKLWKQVKLNDADDSSEATTELKKQTKNETTEKQKTN